MLALVPSRRAALLGGGAAAVFVPTQIAGLMIWADAADAATLFQDSALTTPASANSDPVGGWVSKDAAAHNYLQATAGKRPLLKLAIQNGKPGILTDGLTQFLQTAAFTLNQPMTVFCVARKVSAIGAAERVWCGRTSNGCEVSGSSPLTAYSGNPLTLAANSAACRLLTVVYNTVSSVTYLNGVQQDAGTLGSNNAAGMTLGADQAGLNPSNHYFHEDIVYSGVLAAADLAAVWNYLNAKWAVF